MILVGREKETMTANRPAHYQHGGWEAWERKRLLAMVEQGCSDPEIAHHLGRNRNAVRDERHRLGIYKGASGSAPKGSER